jgi:hypothetical protein
MGPVCREKEIKPDDHLNMSGKKITNFILDMVGKMEKKRVSRQLYSFKRQGDKAMARLERNRNQVRKNKDKGLN